ncbi:MAG: TIGR02281 family clan AA aspartic protease [Algicola sp.]|nr:TIGR02281 family clan AA aspartic protease [Algicola sp.]
MQSDPSQNRSPNPSQKSFGKTFGILAWLCLLFLLVLFFDDQLAQMSNPNSDVEHQLVNNIPTVTLKRNKAGHYVANGFINNQPVTFLLDTGATDVAIPQSVADRIGLTRGVKYSVNTANGRSTAFDTNLDSLELGAIHLTNVNASIVPGYMSNQILLGMSALKQLEFTQRGDQLTLKQY